eukprot:TRINITY_DN12431_c12_g1_i1.p1 TRINITY_DN12431_c12_g1~~TRINITY_DN12431_c12_g1_i1.p1  ORF type:complete len:455 (+),score=83.06 TRINITY_DN12431_c12_g1_i1:116-1480(+)
MLSRLAVLLVAMQTFHWFNPSQPYVRDYIISNYNISDVTLRDQVYAWDVLAELICGVTMAALYVYAGPIPPLILCNIGAFGMTALLVFGESFTSLLISQFMFALGFTALFLVAATLYHTEDIASYQLASSANSSAMLIASTLGGLFGFCVAMASAANADFTLYIAMGSATIAIIINIIAIPELYRRSESPVLKQDLGNERAGLLQHEHVESSDPSSSPSSLSLWRLSLATLSNRRVVFWLICYSSLRAIHTLIIMLWGILSASIAPDPKVQRYNGLITFFGYGLGTLGVWRLAARKQQWHAYAETLTTVTFLTGGCLLVAMASTTQLWQYGILHVIYNGATETIMALLITQLAWAIKALPHIDHSNDQAMFAISMGVRFAVSLSLQALLQLALYPNWGRLSNMFGLDLNVRQQFRILGVVMLTIGVMAGGFAIKYKRLRAQPEETMGQHQAAAI